MAQANERTYSNRIKQVTMCNAFKFLIGVTITIPSLYNLGERDTFNLRNPLINDKIYGLLHLSNCAIEQKI